MSPSRLDAFLNALTPEQRAVLDALIARIADPESVIDAVKEEFFTFALPLVDQVGQTHPGPLWGDLLKTHRVGKRDVQRVPFGELAGALPYPLGFKMRALLRAERRIEEGVDEPQFDFELCSVMGVLVRLAALICVEAYVRSPKDDSTLNHEIVRTLRAPADGSWLNLTRALVRALPEYTLPFVDRVRDALASKPRVTAEVAAAAGARKTGAALDKLIHFRNDLIHGEPITAERRAQAQALLRVAIRGFAWLAEYRLEVLHGETVWSLHGDVPQPVPATADLPPDEPCLVARDDSGESLSLSPLLRFHAGEAEAEHAIAFDELFFVNAGTAERLSYIGYRASQHVDGRTLGSWEAFKTFMSRVPTPPIPRDPCIDMSGLTAFHSRLFVGRRELLTEVTDAIASGDHQYVVLRALAGMGKTAVMASLVQAAANCRQARGAVPSAADGLVRPQYRWAAHFCMPTDGRNSPTVALRSLIAQICDHVKLPREDWLSQDIDALKDEKFPALLAKVGPMLSGGARLVIAIDALDEGIGAEKESVPSCIPAGTYENVVFVLSWRVDADHENSRVAGALKHLEPERLHLLSHASPLRGLTEDDVGSYLTRLDTVYRCPPASPATATAVWEAATTGAVAGSSDGADPFYLRFLADGVQQGSVRLDRAETVPESLDDAFEHMWMNLPTDQDFLCHRVLLTLGIMREYGEDELFAELFNRDRPADNPLTPTDIAAVRIKAGKLLVYDGDRYGLFHDRFRVFLVGEQTDPIAEALGTA